MQEEYLDIVNDDDQIIDRRLRSYIHASGLKHRAVHILVFNSQNQVFLQKRSMRKDLNPGLWDTSAAGHVDSGESYLTCAPRELMEELGVQAELESLFKLKATPALGMEFIQVFRCQHEGPFQLAAEEIDEGAWLDLKQVDCRVAENDPTLTLTFKTIWQTWRG